MMFRAGDELRGFANRGFLRNLKHVINRWFGAVGDDWDAIMDRVYLTCIRDVLVSGKRLAFGMLLCEETPSGRTYDGISQQRPFP